MGKDAIRQVLLPDQKQVENYACDYTRKPSVMRQSEEKDCQPEGEL
jgi:hypothetical protein